MKKWSTVLAGVLVCLLAASPALVRANEMQRLIVDAGINLGLWAAQVELFNTPAGDPSQIGYATNAFNAVTMVRDRLRPPFQNIDLQSVLDQITRYPNYTARWNAGQRANYVKNIYTLFKSRLAVVFLSTRGIYASPNCDSAFLSVGYFLGRAQMGAAANNQYVRSNGRSGLLQAIQSGLKSSQNLGCGFNLQNIWNSVGIARARTLADYQRLTEPIRRVANDAQPVFSPGNPLTPSAGGQTPPPAPSGKLPGTWRFNTGVTVVFKQSGNVILGHTYNHSSELKAVGYQDGMLSYQVSGGNGGVYTGKKYTATSYRTFAWKQTIRITVKGNTATFNELWDGGLAAYTATRVR